MKPIGDIRIFGLKLKRYRQWLQVVREAGRTMPYHVMVRQMIRALLRTSLDNRKRRRLWRKHMKICGSCVLFEPRQHRCGPTLYPALGCRCYMPFKAAAPGPCWIKEHFPENQGGYEI